MSHSRRVFVRKLAGLAAVSLVAPTAIAQSLTPTPIKAIAFDAFVIFDPRPIAALVEELFPGKGLELSTLWRTRQFEYQWLRAFAGNYQDFWSVTQDALVFAAKTIKVDLTDEKREQLMNAYLKLKLWPDVLPALQSLKSKGIQLVFLSNMTEKMLHQNSRNCGIEDMFDHILSTDSNKSYKPEQKAYRIAMDKLGHKKTAIGFAAFAGWDAAGAATFGYPTYWINRQGQVNEELGVTPTWTVNNLTELLARLFT